MEGFFGALVFISVIVSIILRVTVKGAKTDNRSQRKPGLGESILRAMELEQQAKYTQQQANAQRAAAVPEKPIIPHQNSDCTGGSIHDGYHEGTFRKPASASSAEGLQGQQGARRTNYAPGRTGQGMQGREGASSGYVNGLPSREELLREYRSKLEYEKASASHSVAGNKTETAPAAAEQPRESGVEKLAKTIAEKPPMVQGIIWAEILGKPVSEG